MRKVRTLRDFPNMQPMRAELRRMTLVSITLFILVHAPQTQAQVSPPPASSAPTFDVASIKPDREGNHTRVSFNSNSLLATGMTLKALVELAYNVNDSQLFGGPDWGNSAKYEVQAKIDDTTAAALKSLSTEEKQQQRRLMVQALLAERFKLKISQSSKELSIYVLSPVKKGPLFSQSSLPGNATSGITSSSGQTKFSGISLAIFADWLSGQVGRKVIDQTGLQGKFDFTLQWSQEKQTPLTDSNQGPAALSSDSSGPSIFTALQEQLGLKLESSKGPVQVLIIESAEKPTEN
jgi:uncharacterized protein (TIGR03435 family)